MPFSFWSVSGNCELVSGSFEPYTDVNLSPARDAYGASIDFGTGNRDGYGEDGYCNVGWAAFRDGVGQYHIELSAPVVGANPVCSILRIPGGSAVFIEPVFPILVDTETGVWDGKTIRFRTFGYTNEGVELQRGERVVFCVGVNRRYKP